MFTPVPVSGTITLGFPATPSTHGQVSAILSEPISDGRTAIEPEEIVASCDSNGNFTLTLAAVDDSTTTPQGAYYTIRVYPELGGQLAEAFNVAVSSAQVSGVSLYSLTRLNDSVPVVYP